MAQPLKTAQPQPRPEQPALPDWCDSYYAPAPANLGAAPGQGVLEQMYAYYER